MVWQTPIAAGAEGVFWFIVMVFVIISQIAKASKKKTPPDRKPQIPGASASSPEEELGDFLKRLSQGYEEPSSEPPPIAVPMPPPPRPRARPASVPARATNVTQPVQRQIQEARAVRPPAAPIVAPKPVVSAPAIQVSGLPAAASPALAGTHEAVSVPTNKRRDALVAILKNRGSVEEGILLREILGPPLAMRRMASHAYAP